VQFDQMMKMVEVLGLPPQHLLTDAPKVSKYFDRRADGVFVLKQAECRQVTDWQCLSLQLSHWPTSLFRLIFR